MAARGSVGIVTQIGVESTPGTGVACNKKFPGLQIGLKPDLGTRFYRASGGKVPSVGVLNQISSTGSISGPLTFSEITYLLASYTTLVSSTQIGVTSGYTHLFQPAGAGTAETFKTLTVQHGDSTAAQQAAGAIVNALTINLSRTEATVGGGLIAQAIDDTATLTSSPTTLANVPVSGNQWDVYLDSTFGGIGGTRLTDVFSASVNLPEKYKAKWVLNSSLGSWKEGVEVATEPTVSLVTEFNSQMRSVYEALAVSTLPVRYLRLKATGANIGASADYTVQMDFAVKLKSASEQEDVDGVYGYNFEFQLVDDATMGRPYSFTIVNTLTSL